MANFDFDKKGYNPEQVDKFINSLTLKYEEKLSEQKDRVFALKKENGSLKERLETYEQKDKQISKALIFAVEKAEQIEVSARKIYDLEVRRIRLLYNKWKDLLVELENSCPSILANGQLQLDFNEFDNNIQAVIKQNEKFTQGSTIKEDLKKNSDNYIKNLLNKMDYMINEKGSKKEPKMETVEKAVQSHQKKSQKIQSIQNRFKNIALSKVLKDETLDEYMNDKQFETNNAYAKNLTPKTNKIEPNESGFDFDAIINPKEELDEIMKAFDFYNEENL